MASRLGLGIVAWLVAGAAAGAEYVPPAGTQTAMVRPGAGATTVLPGGRFVTHLGRQFRTGPGPFGIAVSPKGTVVATADGGPGRHALTVAERGTGGWRVRHFVAPKDKREEADEGESDWRSVFMGLAFEDERTLFASEGNSGRVRAVDVRDGRRRWVIDLNQGGYQDSYSGDLAYDAQARRLYVVDQANFRLVVIDTERRRVAGSAKVGRLPFAVALAPDGKRAFVTNIGMFEYQAVPGADRKRARETGLDFPAFGFPSPESQAGVKRRTGGGEMVEVPGVGDPNLEVANSLAVVDVSDPEAPKVEKWIRTGLPFGNGVHGGSSPSGVTATQTRVYVSNGHNDTVTVIDAAKLEVVGEVALRIRGLEPYRGVLPIGSAYVAEQGWLLVACAGVNALAVIDAGAMKHIGWIPTAWFPTRVGVREATAHVACAKGFGTGPNGSRSGPVPGSFQGERRRGAVVSFTLPEAGDLDRLSRQVYRNNGFVASGGTAGALPAGIRHVVLIVKENRTFDEVFGDIETAANGPVNGIPILARFGRYGRVNARRGELQTRLGVRDVMVTPNHHEMARRWAFSDNFYADSEVSVDGHHWLVGSYPNAWTESSLMAAYGGQKDFRLPTAAPGRLAFAQSNSSVHPEEQLEAGALWHHLERHGVTFRNFGEGFELAGVDEGAGLKPTGARFLTNVPMPDPLYRNTSRRYPQYNMNIPDQYRATAFINEIEELYRKPGRELPRFLFIHLPNDHMAKARPEDGYPFPSSYVADNDYALGRIVEYLSQTPWWPNMAVFITEDDAQGGIDHVDSHRTILLVVSPFAKKNYVSRVNSSFPGLLKTVFRLLGIPPLNLYDATAQDLSDCFRMEADTAAFAVLPVVKEIFDPGTAKDPLDPAPSPRMDDPRVLREQHRERR